MLTTRVRCHSKHKDLFQASADASRFCILMPWSYGYVSDLTDWLLCFRIEAKLFTKLSFVIVGHPLVQSIYLRTPINPYDVLISVVASFLYCCHPHSLCHVLLRLNDRYLKLAAVWKRHDKT